MRKIVILASALAALLVSAPASAREPSANYWLRQQQATDPGYNGYTGRRYYGGYGYDGYYYGRPLLFDLLFGSHESRKARKGELRTLPDGTTVAYDKASDKWYVVHQPGTQPRGVYTDRDVYEAR